MNVIASIFSLFLASALLFFNTKLVDLVRSDYSSRLICVNNYTKYFSFGNDSQIADFFWIRFLQELDAYNELKIASAHLCPDNVSSWHYHIMNVATDLDAKFQELFLYAPLLISVTIGDSKGASELFDKAVVNFPNDWRILYRASYQAQIEENNLEKAAGLLHRAGTLGAPAWVMSLAGGIYNQLGQRKMAEQIYSELLKDEKDSYAAERLKLKLENKLKNHFVLPPLKPATKTGK